MRYTWAGSVALRVVIRSALLVGFLTSLVEAQSNDRPLPTTPRLLVECFRTTDSLSSEIALQLRRRLQVTIPIQQLYVLQTDIVSDWNAPPRPWQWSTVREVAVLTRADAVIDIVATHQPDGVRVEVHRMRPVRSGEPVSLARTIAPTVQAVVDSLARRLASDTLLLRPAGS